MNVRNYIALVRIFGLVLTILVPTLVIAEHRIGYEGGIETMTSLTSLTARTPFENPISQRGERGPVDPLIIATGYNSDPRQTDDTPCITASGYDVCKYRYKNVVAANFLPLGTRIVVEFQGPKNNLLSELESKVFVVEDRTHERFKDRIDFWFPDKEMAEQFGKRAVHITVL